MYISLIHIWVKTNINFGKSTYQFCNNNKHKNLKLVNLTNFDMFLHYLSLRILSSEMNKLELKNNIKR